MHELLNAPEPAQQFERRLPLGCVGRLIYGLVHQHQVVNGMSGLPPSSLEWNSCLVCCRYSINVAHLGWALRTVAAADRIQAVGTAAKHAGTV